MKKTERSQTYYNKLICKIFILGNASQGESIIFLMYGDDKLIYSCITDSFVIEDKLAVEDIFKSLNIEKIEDLFWTHPHNDHSDGIVKIIDKYKPSHIFIPAELQSLPQSVPGLSRNTLEAINKCKTLDRRCSNLPQICTVCTNKLILNENLTVGSYDIPFYIFGVAPFDSIVRKKALKCSYRTLNDFSIALSITVGDFNILLTGDVQDEVLEYVDAEDIFGIHRPNVLKIPHHGSLHSFKIRNLFQEELDDSNIDISITTSKSPSKLPNEQALNYYNSFSENLYSINSNSSGIATWGVDVDILGRTITNICSNNYLKN